MAPTPDDAAHLGGPITAAYAQAELGLLARIARAIGRGGGKLGQALAKVLSLKKASSRIAARLGRTIRKELPPLVVQAYEIGAAKAAAELAALRALDGSEVLPPEGSPSQEDSLAGGPGMRIRAGAGRDVHVAPGLPGPADPGGLADRLVSEFHPQILRAADDAYRRIVAEVYAPALADGQSRLVASQRALDRLASEGITGFTDRAGRQWRIESYVEMAMRAAFGRAAIAGALDRYRADGVALVGVPDIPHNCSRCAPFEGKVLAIAPGAVAPEGVTVYATVEQAFARGFGHPNCRHSLVPVLGAATAAELRARHRPHDEAGYRATQRQRELERRIRRAKRRLVAAQESGAPTGVVKARRDDVQQRQADIRAYLAAHPELLRYSSREQTRGAGEHMERAI